jgi:hypothetical protein
MWDLWWTKWHSGVFPEFFDFPQLLPFHHGSPCLYIIWGMKNKPVNGRSSGRYSHPIDMNNNSMGRSSAGQENLRLLWKQMAHYRVHISPPQAPVLSHTNSVHTLKPYILMIYFNIICACVFKVLSCVETF